MVKDHHGCSLPVLPLQMYKCKIPKNVEFLAYENVSVVIISGGHKYTIDNTCINAIHLENIWIFGNILENKQQCYFKSEADLWTS